MDNSAALRAGGQKAKDIIARHVLNAMLIPFAKDVLDKTVQWRIQNGHNMTGNTINAYAVGVYVRGQLVWMQTPSGTIPGPLQRKLGKRQKFHSGRQRWDEEWQKHPFKGKVATNGGLEPDRSVAFLRSYKAVSDGWEIVVCNGVEYAAFQENMMKIDVLTASFDYAKMFALTMFNPLPA